MRFVFGLALLAACRGEESVPDAAPPSASTSASPAALGAKGEWLEPLLDGEGHPTGNVAIAVNATDRRPIVVAVHGAATRADWMCSAARATLGPRPFIVCPHPSPNLEAEVSWGTPAQLRQAIERSLEALTRRFGPWLERDEALYFGHSQGAMFGPAALAGSTAHVRYAILFEGLPRDRPGALSALRAAHVERVLLASGQSGWQSGHAQFAAQLATSGIAAKHIHRDVGHFFNAEVHALIHGELGWLLAGDRAWED